MVEIKHKVSTAPARQDILQGDALDSLGNLQVRAPFDTDPSCPPFLDWPTQAEHLEMAAPDPNQTPLLDRD